MARVLKPAHSNAQSYNWGNPLVTSTSFLWEVPGTWRGPVPVGEPGGTEGGVCRMGPKPGRMSAPQLVMPLWWKGWPNVYRRFGLGWRLTGRSSHKLEQGAIGYRQHSERLNRVVSVSPVMVYRELLLMNHTQKIPLDARVPLYYRVASMVMSPLGFGNSAWVFIQGDGWTFRGDKSWAGDNAPWSLKARLVHGGQPWLLLFFSASVIPSHKHCGWGRDPTPAQSRTRQSPVWAWYFLVADLSEWLWCSHLLVLFQQTESLRSTVLSLVISKLKERKSLKLAGCGQLCVQDWHNKKQNWAISSSKPSLLWLHMGNQERNWYKLNTYSACGTQVFSINVACSIFLSAIHIIFYLSICSWKAANDVSWPCFQHYPATAYEHLSRAEGTSELSWQNCAITQDVALQRLLRS